MSSTSRAAQFAKIHKVLKKLYKPVAPNADRPVLEHLIFACCLENAHYEKAEEAYAALVHSFFDWNEVRVTTVKELSEVLHVLPDPAAAAQRVKRSLQHVFEAAYSFDLEELRKKNIGLAQEKLQGFAGSTPFVVAYVIQSGLGGHCIPLDSGALEILQIVDAATPKEVAAGSVQGLERAIAKNKGVEFGSLLHQLAADFVQNPFAPAVHKIILQIEPNATDRLPTRRKVAAEKAAAEKAAAEKAAAAKVAAEKAAAAKVAAAKAAAEKAAAEKAKAKAKPAPVEPAADKKKAGKVKPEEKPKAEEKAPARPEPKADKSAAKKKPAKLVEQRTARKATGITKRKPR